MSGALVNLLAFIVAISVLVAVHEFGHYIVGRACGMKVLRFSIGFGKPVWMRVAGEDRTEYCISAIPLGGYVKFLDEREGPIEAQDQGRAFNHKPVASRIAVLLAGTYAATAGLEFGDRILQVGDRAATDWETALVSMLDEMLDDGRVQLELESEDGWVRKTVIDVGGDASRLTEPGMLFDGLGFQPWQPPAVVGEVTEEATKHCPVKLRSVLRSRMARCGGSSVSASVRHLPITGMYANMLRSRPLGRRSNAPGHRLGSQFACCRGW
jgi:regulator of sigma E protease